MQQINNKITALFMGEIDTDTGNWFPIKKMTWGQKKRNNYVNCRIEFTQGANKYQMLHPNTKNLFMPRDTNKVMEYKDVLSCSWRNRMPVSRSLEAELKICLGFDSASSVDPIEFVARDGGHRYGDRRDLFPEIESDQQGNYNFIFRGVDSWVMSSDNRQNLETTISVGDRVSPLLKEDIEQTSWTANLTLSDPIPEAIRMKLYVKDQLVGYAPFWVKELYQKFGEAFEIKIYQKNLGMPFEYQFLFLATVNKDAGVPFSQPEYQPCNYSTRISSSSIQPNVARI